MTGAGAAAVEGALQQVVVRLLLLLPCTAGTLPQSAATDADAAAAVAEYSALAVAARSEEPEAAAAEEAVASLPIPGPGGEGVQWTRPAGCLGGVTAAMAAAEDEQTEDKEV